MGGRVAVGVTIGAGMAVGVDVDVDDGAGVGGAVKRGVTVGMGVTVGEGAAVGVGVEVAAGVGEAVDGGIAGGVGVTVGAVGVDTAVGVGVEVAAGVGVTADGGVAVGAGVVLVDWCLSHWQKNKAAKPSVPALMATRTPNSASVATHLLSSPERPQSVIAGPRARLSSRPVKSLSWNLYIEISTVTSSGHAPVSVNLSAQ